MKFVEEYWSDRPAKAATPSDAARKRAETPFSFGGKGTPKPDTSKRISPK